MNQVLVDVIITYATLVVCMMKMKASLWNEKDQMTMYITQEKSGDLCWPSWWRNREDKEVLAAGIRKGRSWMVWKKWNGSGTVAKCLSKQGHLIARMWWCNLGPFFAQLKTLNSDIVKLLFAFAFMSVDCPGCSDAQNTTSWITKQLRKCASDGTGCREHTIQKAEETGWHKSRELWWQENYILCWR